MSLRLDETLLMSLFLKTEQFLRYLNRYTHVSSDKLAKLKLGLSEERTLLEEQLALTNGWRNATAHQRRMALRMAAKVFVFLRHEMEVGPGDLGIAEEAVEANELLGYLFSVATFNESLVGEKWTLTKPHRIFIEKIYSSNIHRIIVSSMIQTYQLNADFP